MTLKEFAIEGLHGHKNICLRFTENTLILVGENGTAKTTIVNLLYYFLTGQWALMRRYTFERLSITIDDFNATISHSDLTEIDGGFTSTRTSNTHDGSQRRPTNEADNPLSRLLFSQSPPVHPRGLPEWAKVGIVTPPSVKRLDEISEQLSVRTNCQILYLPTYRRIEQTLGFILKGNAPQPNERQLELDLTKTPDKRYVELVEFGMQDVEDSIDAALGRLSNFTRQSLNSLTFEYLSNIVEEQYEHVDFEEIKKVKPETINSILRRIPDRILSEANKTKLQDIIKQAQTQPDPTKHAGLLCHYFIKLLTFDAALERKEAPVKEFCELCNNYLVDKVLHYDSFAFKVNIRLTNPAANEATIGYHQLSSGEKQLLSIFSHLYLSGAANHFVIIDEPELSLSVPWQRMFLNDIKSSPRCTGLVSVTHSPFIYDNDLKPFAHGIGEFTL